ncbi:hypothetical protein Acr_00g0012520 [Actinidia rufa]|uniref:Uncharacterized protein n=1 Tax=Actinidia rufa TaxID=165716 RepID=A0A7J0DB64_9ERIC|nr:hypothetical protein Acr_00g0012520 [Actinidia rufa]
MIPTRLTNLVLCLLYLLHAIRASSAYAHQTSEMLGNGLISTGKNVASFQKETVDDVPVATARKMKLGGRKLIVAVSRREIEKEGELNIGETSVISGATHDFARKCYELEGKQDLNEKLVLSDKRKDRNASKRVGRSQDQNNSPMLEPKTLKPVHFPSSNPHGHFQASKAVSTKATLNNSSKSNTQVSQEPAQKDESQRLVEAAEEIANLMRKDYKDDGKPRHTPPINNHKPTD